MKSEKFLQLKPEIATMLEAIKGKITREIVKKNHDLKTRLRETTAALNEINEDSKDSELLKSHIYPLIAFLETAGKILDLPGIHDLIGRIRLSFNQSADDSQADVQTALLKLAPEILDITHNLQTTMGLKIAFKKFHKLKKNKQSALTLELENLYVMSTVVEEICEAWEQTPLNFESLSIHSSNIMNFFLQTLSDLYVEHPHSDLLFKLETQLFKLIDNIYNLLGKPHAFYSSQLRSKCYQALYLFSQKEIDTQAAILALNNVLLFNSHDIVHQLEKIHVLDMMSLGCRNIINRQKIPQPERFSEIFLIISTVMMTTYLDTSTPDSKAYSGIVQNVVEVAIFCQKDRQNVKDLISRLQILITANNLTTELSEQQCLIPLELIIQFITASSFPNAIWLSLLFINVVEQFTSRIFTSQIIRYRATLAELKQDLTVLQTRHYGSVDFKKTSSVTQIDFDEKKFSALKPRIITNISESQKKLQKIYQKNNEDKSVLRLSPILESLTQLGESIRKFPKRLENPNLLREIPLFFLQVISYLSTVPQYDEFQFKSDLLDCIDDILSLFSQDSKTQFFQFQCYFLKIRELLSRTNPDIDKITALVEKLTAESCDPGRLQEQQLLIFEACQSYFQKFNYLKTPQIQDKFIPNITFMLQKIIHIHEKSPDRIIETIQQILAIASFFLCVKGPKSTKSQLIYRGTEEVVEKLHRIVSSYEKSKAALPSTEDCLSILTTLNKIIIMADSLKNLDKKWLNWLLQTGRFFFVKALHNHASISKFQDLLEQQTLEDMRITELSLQEEKINELKQKEEKVRQTPCTTKIPAQVPTDCKGENNELQRQENTVRKTPMKLKTPPLTLAKENPQGETLQNEIKQKKAELLALTNRNEFLKKEVQTLNRSLAKNRKKYDTAINQNEELTKKLQASEQCVLQLQQDLAKKTEYVTQVQHNEQIIATLKIEIKKEQDDHKNLRSTCDSLNLEKAELQQSVETLTVELKKQKQDNLKLIQAHDQELESHAAERDRIIQKYEAEKKADATAKTKQFLSLHQEIARLKIKAREVHEQSPPQSPWRPHFPYSSGASIYYVVPSFSPPDSESSESEEPVYGY